MITLFEPNETDFTHNGLGNLDKNIIDSVVEEDLNGLFSLSFRYPIFALHGLEIEGQSIIRAPVPNGPDQLFRVYKPIKSMGYLEVECYHVFYDLIDNLIEDTNIVEKDGQTALTQMGSRTQYDHNFRFFSDITTIAGSRVVRKNPVEFLLDDSLDNSFVNRWGGELKRNNFDISMYNSIGSDKGVTIRHKKDLLGYEAVVDWSSAVTRIMPIGFDGLLLPEKYIDSPVINSYIKPKIQQLEYGDVKAAIGQYADDDDAIPLEEAYKELRRLAKLEYTKGGIDYPKASYKVEFATLSETEEYKDYKELEKVDLGDTVTIIHDEDNLHIKAKVIKYRFDPVAKKYIDVELGNFREKFSDIQGKIDSIYNRVEEVKQDLSLTIQISADGKNTIYRGVATPVNARVGDLWYKPIDNGNTEMYQFTDDPIVPWQLIFSTASLNEISKEVNAAIEQADADRQKTEQDIAQAITDAQDYTNQKATEFDNKLTAVNQDISNVTNAANTAVLRADKAIEDVGFMKVDVNAAKVNAANAISTAQTAISNSGTALTNAQNALDAYNNLEIGGRNLLKGTAIPSTPTGNGGANQTSNPYLFTVDTSTFLERQITTSFKWRIEGVSSATGTFYIQGSNPYSQLSGNNVRIDVSSMSGEFARTTTLYGEVNVGFAGARIRMDNVTAGAKLIIYDLKIEYGNKATSWTAAPEDVQVQITDINGELVRKVSQTTFDTLNGVVGNHTTQINQTQTALTAKADSQLVNTIKGTVDQHTLDIAVTSQGLTFKADSSRVDTIKGTVDQHTAELGVQAQAITARLTSIQIETLLTGKQYVNQAQLTATSTTWNLALTQVSTDLSNLKIGGRNLVIRNDEEVGYYLNLDGTKVVATNHAVIKNTISVVPGETLTFTKINSNKVGNPSFWRVNLYNVNNVYISRFADSSNEFQWKVPTGAYFIKVSYPIDSNPKVERGNKATGWSQAPEDLTTVEKTASLELRIDGFQLSLIDKVSTAQFTVLSGQVQSKVESATYSTKMTQLDNLINTQLVHNGDVVAQFNMDNGTTLIQNRKLLLDADTYIMGTTFANDVKAKSLEAVYADIATLKTRVLTADVITSTMIKSDTALITKLFATDANVQILTAKTAFVNSVKAVEIAADRITTGIFNAAKATIINMNASNIVTGTLSGINISGVNFTGTNMTLQNRLTIATESGGIHGNFDFANDVDGTFNPRYFRGNYRLGTNHLNLQSDNYNIASGGTSGSHLGYSETYYGSDYLKMRIYNNSTNLAIKSRVDITSSFIQIADNFNATAGVRLLPDGSVNASTADIRGLLKVGTDINVVGQSILGGRIDITGSTLLRSTLDVQGSSIFRTTVDIAGSSIFRSTTDFQGSSIFRSSLDVRGNLIAQGAYDNTYSSAANLFISSNGYIGRATSATKYKLNISEIDLSTGYADKVLALKPKQWIDKRQLEQTGVAETYYGLIAEDLVNLGLDKYVQRGMNGEVEGIMYDRLWTLLIPIVKQQSEEIKELKNKISKLESVA